MSPLLNETACCCFDWMTILVASYHCLNWAFFEYMHLSTQENIHLILNLLSWTFSTSTSLEHQGREGYNSLCWMIFKWYIKRNNSQYSNLCFLLCYFHFYFYLVWFGFLLFLFVHVCAYMRMWAMLVAQDGNDFRKNKVAKVGFTCG